MSAWWGAGRLRQARAPWPVMRQDARRRRAIAPPRPQLPQAKTPARPPAPPPPRARAPAASSGAAARPLAPELTQRPGAHALYPSGAWAPVVRAGEEAAGARARGGNNTDKHA